MLFIYLWSINANTVETGRSWRFSKERMGDYLIGYVNQPNFPLADAITISAAFPYLISPYKLDLEKFNWKKFKSFESEEMVIAEPKMKNIHLQDGGMYENLGVEALFKSWPVKLRKEINTLIVSDASSPLSITDNFIKPIRPLNILSEQVRNLRTRGTISYMTQNEGHGFYLQLGQKLSSFKKHDLNNIIEDVAIYEIKNIKQIYPKCQRTISLL